MATGDLKNNLKQFQSQVKSIKYPSVLDVEGLKNGSPQAYLPLYHYLFTSYSNKFNKDIVNSNNELYGKSDLRFVEAVYKIMRVLFSHKPAITREQFFATGFAERKLIMATEIFRLVHSHYKPQKSSSSYKLAANLEKPKLEAPSVVHQDIPEPTKTRKIASRSPDMSCAVVLPRSFSGSSLIRSSHKVPVPLSATEKHHSAICSPETATPRSESSDHHVREQKRQAQQNVNSFPDMTSEMTKKMADQLTHSVIFLNEKIGKMALAIQNQEQRIESRLVTKAETVEQASAPNALVTNLSKQMNDIIFKMDTLSSRVVLLENRMMMMEAKVDDTQSFCRMIVANRSRPQSEVQSLTESWLNRNSSNNNRVDSCHGDAVRQEEVVRNPTQQISGRNSHRVVREFASQENATRRENVKEKAVQHQINNRAENAKDPANVEDDSSDEEEESEEDKIIDVIGVEKEDVAASGPSMAFMKSLVDPNNTAMSNLTSNDCTLTTSQTEQVNYHSESKGSAKHQCQGHNANTDKVNELPKDQVSRKLFDQDRFADNFGKFFSPIRSFADTSAQNVNCDFQDSSAISIPCATGDEEERRFSTPNKVSLDTSTLSRVNRITQMLTETEQLFQ